MVERSNDSSNHDKEGGGDHVARDKEDCEEVVVLPADKLERMDVDGVHVAARGSMLHVVVLVDVLVDRTKVEGTVEHVVEKVVYSWDGEDSLRWQSSGRGRHAVLVLMCFAQGSGARCREKETEMVVSIETERFEGGGGGGNDAPKSAPKAMTVFQIVNSSMPCAKGERKIALS